MTEESRLREAICRFGSNLYLRGHAHGSSGNISVRIDDGILVTPTNSCLGMLDPTRITKVNTDGSHISGDQASKETFLHLAMYEERQTARGIVHLHCTHAVAVSCRCHVDTSNVLPPLTAYHVMRVGRLPLIPYFRPGDRSLAEAVRKHSRQHTAVLLANHGPVVAGKSLEDSVYTMEELEETAKLSLMLAGQQLSLLTADQIADLHQNFPN